MEAEWTDVDLMIDDMRSYLKENKDFTIIQNDKPMKLIIGYRCEQSDKEWNIKITNIKNSKSPHRMAFKNEAAKEGLLEFINSIS